MRLTFLVAPPTFRRDWRPELKDVAAEPPIASDRDRRGRPRPRSRRPTRPCWPRRATRTSSRRASPRRTESATCSTAPSGGTPPPTKPDSRPAPWSSGWGTRVTSHASSRRGRSTSWRRRPATTAAPLPLRARGPGQRPVRGQRLLRRAGPHARLPPRGHRPRPGLLGAPDRRAFRGIVAALTWRWEGIVRDALRGVRTSSGRRPSCPWTSAGHLPCRRRKFLILLREVFVRRLGNPQDLLDGLPPFPSNA